MVNLQVLIPKGVVLRPNTHTNFEFQKLGLKGDEFP